MTLTSTTTTASPTCKERIYSNLGVSHPFDESASYVTSPFFSPWVLAFLRLTMAFYSLASNVFALVWHAVVMDRIGRFFPYFTQLSYIGLCAYFFASGVQTLVYAQTKGETYPLRSWPRFLQFLHLLLFSTIITYPFIVTVVYWVVLFPDDELEDSYDVWAQVTNHALNSVFALFEIFFTNAGPPPWWHMLFVFILIAMYLGVAYITRATQGFYTYSFLDPAKQGAALAGWIVGIGVACIAVFSAARMLCVLRVFLVRKFGIGIKVNSDAPGREGDGPIDPAESVDLLNVKGKDGEMVRKEEV